MNRSHPEHPLQKFFTDLLYRLAFNSGAESQQIGKSKLPRWKGLLNSLGWLVHQDMNPEIVAELIRIIYENADQFEKYHAGAGITPKTIGRLPVPEETP